MKASGSTTFLISDLLAQKILSIGDGYRAKNSELSATGIPFARVANIDGGFQFENADFFPLEDLEKVGDKVSRISDIVFTSKGTVGRFAFVKPATPQFVYSPQLCFWRVLNQDVIEPRFLYYWMHAREFRTQVDSVKGQTDMADYVSLSDQRRMKITLPSLSTQRRIADILSALDDKIELNRQTNATLEAIAQAIFKEWFVDFNFPSGLGFEGFGDYRDYAAARLSGEPLHQANQGKDMVESELGLIPRGWRVGKVGDVAAIKHGFAFKGEFFSEEENDDILLTPGNFRIGGGFNYAKFKYYKGPYPQEYLLNRGDLIVTMTDLSKEGDTLGFPALVPTILGKNLLHNQRIGKVEVNKNNSIKLYLYFSMQQSDYRNYILSGATGTTVKHTSPSRICDCKIVLPSLNVLRMFENIVQPLIDCVETNHIESNTLAQLRDSLLPKLLNGEVDVCTVI